MGIKIPLPNTIYRSADAAVLSGGLGARLVDGFIGDLNEIIKRPGLKQFIDIGTNKPTLGMFWWGNNSKMAVVSDGRIFTINDSVGNFTEVTGDALTPTGKTYFANDGTFLVMANGGKIVHYNNAGTTAFVTDIDAPTEVTHVAFIDGYILALQKNSGLVWYFDVNAFPNINPLNFFNAESSPDNAVALHVANGEIAIFGENSVEFWFNDGVNPFRVIQQATIQFGCVAADSVVNISGNYVWLDSNRRVSTIQGRNPITLSGPFDDVIRDLTPVSDAKACWFNLGRRQFYILNFPTANKTFVVDLTTAKWYEWGEWNVSLSAYDRLRFQSCEFARDWDFSLTGDISTGKIYKISRDNFTENGDTLRTSILSGHISHGTSSRKRCNRIRIRLKRGAGGVSDNEPKMLIRWKNDNGLWGTFQEISLGKMGESEFFKDLRSCGVYQTRQYEFVHADDSDFILIEAEEEIALLNS